MKRGVNAKARARTKKFKAAREKAAHAVEDYVADDHDHGGSWDDEAIWECQL